MQTRPDLERKLSAALNRLQRMTRSRDHFARQFEFHLAKSRRRGWQIHGMQTDRWYEGNRSNRLWTRFVSWLTATPERPHAG